jgi:hypothetical protein
MPFEMRIQRMIVALTGTLLAACSGETVAQPPPAPVDWRSFEARAVPDAGPSGPTEKERALAGAYTTGLASPGFAQLGSLLDDDAHLATPGRDDAHGRDAVVRVHDVLFGAFDSRSASMSRVWRTDSTQAVEWTMTGVQARDWMGVAATHKPVAFGGLTLLWTKDDGSVTDVHVYFDVAVVKAQLGVGPKELVSVAATMPARPASAAPRIFEQTGFAEEKIGLALVRAELDALENNNEAAYVAAVTDDVEVYTLERAQPRRGKDDIRAYFKAMHKAIGQLDTTIDNAWGIAHFAVVEYEIAGEQLGPIGWIAARRDKVVRLHVADLIEIRDAKIARVWRYDNPAEITASSPGP